MTQSRTSTISRGRQPAPTPGAKQRTRVAIAPEPSKTRRLFLALRHAITSGEIGPGGRLQSEPELARSWGVSRVTVRRALDALEREGLIVRKSGTGTFVAEHSVAQMVVSALPILLGSVRAAGRKTAIRLISLQTVSGSSQVTRALELDQGAAVQRCERVRTIDGLPFTYLVSWIPERLSTRYTARELRETPLFELLEGAGVRVSGARQRLVAEPATPDVAHALGIDVGVAIVCMTRVARDDQGRPVEYLYAAYHPTRAAFEFELDRVGADAARHWELRQDAPLPRPVAQGADAAPGARPRPGTRLRPRRSQANHNREEESK